jgi:hypothetical protein
VYTVPDAGGAANFVMSEGTQTINGAKTLTNATVSFPTTGGTPTALNYYEDYSENIEFNGDFGLTPTPNPSVRFVRIGAMVMMTVPTFSEPVSVTPASSSLASLTNIPARFRPLIDAPCRITMISNGAGRQGNCIVRTTGLIEIFFQTVSGSQIQTTDVTVPPNGNIGTQAFTHYWLV